MNTHIPPMAAILPQRRSLCGVLVAISMVITASFLPAQDASKDEPKEARPSPDLVARVQVGRNVFLEVQGKKRRVVVQGSVCLRKGALELLLCRSKTKEHEAALKADVDGRDIHKALLLAGAKAGSPVQYEPKYQPATGQVIDVLLQYEVDGKKKTIPAQQWVKRVRDGKQLDQSWVFAGSKLVPDPLEPKKPPIYLANDGDLICVSNFDTAMLDLPIKSPKDNDSLAFEAFTDRIPAVDTAVLIILEPRPAK